ncbi:MAG: IPT/TIG domain-containing protein [Dehalococcoidia bacterium]|nr:IPT/TIG domain-containing protein [Dehalococcoidia bacterium]
MRIKVLAIISLLIVVTCFIPAGVAQAASISPSEGIVGTEVTISDLWDGYTYSIFWDGTLIKQGTTGSSGYVIFTVPAGYSGEHQVIVEQPINTQVLNTTFTIVPSISIDSTTGSIGTNIVITGHGFAINEDNINVTYDGTSMKSNIEADDEGTWTTTFTVPASIKGKHSIDAYGDTTATSDVSNKYFTVSPTVKISPTSGGVGTVIAVTATGFASSESSIKVMFAGATVRSGITADTLGSWSTSFSVPDSPKGSQSIGFQGSSTSSGDIADKIFEISPAITLSQTSGSVDDEIKISGSGFGNNDSAIEVTFDGKVLERNITADANGTWSVNVKIPATSGGAHVIGASGRLTAASDVATVTFTVESILSVLPKSGSVNDEIRVSGSGFTANKDFSVTWDNNPVSTGTVNDSGVFQTTFKAPAGKSGEIKITATDSKGVTATGTFTMETTAPEVPQIASPKDGATVGFMGNTRVVFKWSDISDPSGVTYDLEVSDQSNFDKILVSRTKLSDVKYTLTEAEALPNGEYYWHVRAIDGAGNTSAWSPVAMVKAGLVTVSTIIWIVVCIVVLIIAVAIINRVLHRKKHHKHKRTSDWE